MNEEQVNCFVNLIFDRLNLWIYDYGKEEALVYFVQYLTLFQKGYQANDALDITKKIMYLLIYLSQNLMLAVFFLRSYTLRLKRSPQPCLRVLSPQADFHHDA